MGFKKNLIELLSEPSEMDFSKVQNILLGFNFKLARIKGSHFSFKNLEKGIITIPVHNQKVKRIYLKRVKYIIISLK